MVVPQQISKYGIYIFIRIRSQINFNTPAFLSLKSFSEIEEGCDLLIATPGRLNDLYSRGIYDYTKVSFLTLDEADR